MKDKNIVINNYASALVTLVSNLASSLSGLNEDKTTNDGVIKTADILITAVNSQLVILQSELDKYGG